MWSLVGRGWVRVEGVILAGGFVRHPMRWGVPLAERLSGKIPLSLFVRILYGYAKVARFRYRHSPETLANIHEFIARRTELDRDAAVHRLRLVGQNDPRSIAQRVKAPVYALTGLIDPIVPWWWVRSWLKKKCPALRTYRILAHADHNVLSTGAQCSAEQILKWMGVKAAGS